LRSALHELGEHFLRVDGDEGAFAAGQHFVFIVSNFSAVDVDAALNADFPALDVQRFVQGDGLKVFNGHLFGEGDYVAEFVYLAHGVIEDGGDDAAVAVAGRAGVALAEAELADEGLAGFVEGEFQPHAVGIVLAASEAVVFLQLDVAGVVALALGFAGHDEDFNLRAF
jgi:hypothetical protein